MNEREQRLRLAAYFVLSALGLAALSALIRQEPYTATGVLDAAVIIAVVTVLNAIGTWLFYKFAGKPSKLE